MPKISETKALAKAQKEQSDLARKIAELQEQVAQKVGLRLVTALGADAADDLSMAIEKAASPSRTDALIAELSAAVATTKASRGAGEKGASQSAEASKDTS